MSQRHTVVIAHADIEDIYKKIRRAERQTLALKHALVALCRILWVFRPIDRTQIEAIVSSLETVKPSDS